MSAKNLTLGQKFALLSAGAGRSGKTNFKTLDSTAKNGIKIVPFKTDRIKRDHVCDPTASNLGYKYAVVSKDEKCVGYFISYQKAVSSAKKNSGRIVYLVGDGKKMPENLSTVERAKFKLLSNPFNKSDLKHVPETTSQRIRESMAPGVKELEYIKGSPIKQGGRVYNEGTKRWENEISTAWPIPDEINIPAPNNRTYFPHQKAAIVAMSRRPNTLLADEQGLGKTIEIAGFLNLNDDVKKTVIICPSGVKYNWELELHDWLVDKSKKIYTYESHKGDMKFSKRKTFSNTDNERIVVEPSDDFDVLIVNRHSTINARSFTQLKRFLRTAKPDLLVIDEVHLFKNPDAISTKNVFGAGYDSDTGITDRGIVGFFNRKIFLSGTPLVKDDLMDLFHLLNALDPKSFSSRSVYEEDFTFTASIKGRGAKGEDKADAAEKKKKKKGDSIARNIKMLGIKLRDTVLVRRLRKDLLDLPPMQYNDMILDRSDPDIARAIRLEKEAITRAAAEKGMSEDEIRQSFEDLAHTLFLSDEQKDEQEASAIEDEEKTISDLDMRKLRLSKADKEIWKKIRGSIESLEDVLDDPDLSDDAKRKIKAEHEKKFEQKLDMIALSRIGIDFQDISRARNEMGKAKAKSFAKAFVTLRESLKDKIESEKFVIFFNTHECKEEIKRQLKIFGANEDEIVEISGKVKDKEKQKSVERFQRDPKVKYIVGQINTAGVGITLTKANVAIFVEFDWNPGPIQQAQDRIYRIGQNAKNIYSCFMIVPGTIDSNLVSCIQRKRYVQRALFDTIPTEESIDQYEAGYKINVTHEGKYSTDQRAILQKLAKFEYKFFYPDKKLKDNIKSGDFEDARKIKNFMDRCDSSQYEIINKNTNEKTKLGARHYQFPESAIDEVLPALFRHKDSPRGIHGFKPTMVKQIHWPQWVTGIEAGVFAPVKVIDRGYSFFKYLDFMTNKHEIIDSDGEHKAFIGPEEFEYKVKDDGKTYKFEIKTGSYQKAKNSIENEGLEGILDIRHSYYIKKKIDLKSLLDEDSDESDDSDDSED